jgi:myo-inositol-1(or 4)-monophosphatase
LLDWRKRFSVREKGPADLVTDADLASQEAIRRSIAAQFPTHRFVGEETPEALDLIAKMVAGTATDPQADDWTWVVDPLDGTTNYVHGLAQYAVSVALLHGAEIVAGCVYDPIAEECFTAEKGQGARRNGEPVGVSRTTALDQALVAVSFGAKVESDSPEIDEFLRILPRVQAFRRMGSAALNLCYVAAGRLDAYWSTSTKLWDIAAGELIVRESGGVMTAPDGQPLAPTEASFIAASTAELHRAMVDVLQLGG